MTTREISQSERSVGIDRGEGRLHKKSLRSWNSDCDCDCDCVATKDNQLFLDVL